MFALFLFLLFSFSVQSEFQCEGNKPSPKKVYPGQLEITQTIFAGTVLLHVQAEDGTLHTFEGQGSGFGAAGYVGSALVSTTNLSEMIRLQDFIVYAVADRGGIAIIEFGNSESGHKAESIGAGAAIGTFSGKGKWQSPTYDKSSPLSSGSGWDWTFFPISAPTKAKFSKQNGNLMMSLDYGDPSGGQWKGHGYNRVLEVAHDHGGYITAYAPVFFFQVQKQPYGEKEDSIFYVRVHGNGLDCNWKINHGEWPFFNLVESGKLHFQAVYKRMEIAPHGRQVKVFESGPTAQGSFIVKLGHV